MVLYTEWDNQLKEGQVLKSLKEAPMEGYSMQDYFFLGSLSDRACPTNIKQIPGAQLSRFEIQRSKLDILTYAKALDLCVTRVLFISEVSMPRYPIFKALRMAALDRLTQLGKGAAMLQDEKPKTYDKHVGVSENRGIYPKMDGL